MISLHTPSNPEEDSGELVETIPDTANHIEAYEVRTASQKEIQEFSEALSRFGLTFSDVADNCPRQERTFAACRRVLDFARSRPELLKRVEDTGKLPMNELASGSCTTRRLWSGTGNIWWLSCWPSPTAMRSSGGTCARSARPKEGARNEISGHGDPPSLCGGAGRGGALPESGQPPLPGGRYRSGDRGTEDAAEEARSPLETPVRPGWPGRLPLPGILWVLPAQLRPLWGSAHPDQSDVELTLSRTDRVLELEGLNPDGEELITGYNFSGKDREDVTGELVERAISMGYLSSGETVSITVSSDDTDWQVREEQEAREDLEERYGEAIVIQIGPAAEEPPAEEVVIPVTPSAPEPVPESAPGAQTGPPTQPAVSEDTDYAPNSDGITDYSDTDYGPYADGVTDYGDDGGAEAPYTDGMTDYKDRDDDGGWDGGLEDDDWDNSDSGDNGWNDDWMTATAAITAGMTTGRTATAAITAGTTIGRTTTIRSCLKIGNVPNGERFFRQTRRFNAAILCVSQGKSTRYGGKRSAVWAC